MDSYNVKISSLTLKRRKEKYPRGANSPTITTVYKCLCGKGKIVEENTIGFNDHFVTLECRKCLKTHHPFVDIVGNEFKFYLK